MRVKAQCKVPGCAPTKHGATRGYCPKHLYRFDTYGDPLVTRMAVGSNEEKLAHYGWTVQQNGCWVWGGPIGAKGYGRLGNVEVQRIAYETWVGPITKGQQVRHTCDNRPCICPDHLILGTVGDNMRDKVERGRQAKGSRVGTAKLTEVQVLEIRRQLNIGVTACSLGEKYGVSGAMIGYIKKGAFWRHLLDKEVVDLESAASEDAGGE